MAVHCHIWLVILASIFSQCGALEYYVKPTDFANDICPGQPCLSINEYTNDIAYYTKSNMVFTFLPGKHIVKRPIVLKDVQNISLAASSGKNDTNITTQFMCQDVNDSKRSVPHCGDVWCSVIGLINVNHVSINGLTIETNSCGITGVTIQKSCSVHIIKMDTFCTADIYSKCFFNCGITIFQSNYIFVNGLQTSHHSSGIVLLNTSNTLIENSLFLNSLDHGVHMNNTANVSLLNTIISNEYNAMNELWGNNTRMENVITHKRKFVPNDDECFDTPITDKNATNNSCGPLCLVNCTQIQVRNLFVESSQRGAGIEISTCTNVVVVNVNFSYNMVGFVISSGKHIYLSNITLHSNNNCDLSCGINIAKCCNTTMAYINSYINNQRGINVISSTDTTMSHLLLTSERYAIRTTSCENTILVNVSITHLKINGRKVMVTVGIIMENSTTISMKNMTVALFTRTGLDFYNCSDVTLEHSTFSTIYPTTTKEYFQQSAIVSLKDTSITLSNCVFTKNNITSLKAISSNITLHGNLVFANNQALYGAVFVLVQSSVMIFSESCNATFQNNSAIDYGGVFYIITEEFFARSKTLYDIRTRAHVGSETKSTTNCFFQIEGVWSNKILNFVGNTAGKGGDVLFGGLVALGWDGDVNCLDSFKSISDFSGQNEASVISSAPSCVCLCRELQKDCLIVADPTTHTIYPGETLVISAVVVGQDFGTVTGSVIAQLLLPSGSPPTSLEQGQSSLLFNNGPCQNLNYTFYTNCVDCKTVLVLKTNNAKVLDIMTTEDNDKLNYAWNVDVSSLTGSDGATWHYVTNHKDRISSINAHAIDTFINTVNGKFSFSKDYPLYVNVSFLSCPSGFSLTAVPPFKCDCNNLLKQIPGVTCTIQDQSISRGGSVWIGNYGNKSVAASKYCPLNYCNRNEINITLMYTNSTQQSTAKTDVQCNYNHSGILCGGCQPGLSLALGSDRCLQCSSYFTFLLLPYAIAGVILVLVIKMLNLTISEGTLNTLIFYANVIKANRYLYYDQTSVNPMTLFIAWLNLDLGIETCFFSGLTAYGRTWLQFVFPLYLWGIASLIIILAKYSHRVAKLMGNNGVPVLATLFLLSYAKLFNTIIDSSFIHNTIYNRRASVSVVS